ncbi:hypothetical protein E2C01_009684 [Portunus trituberculatus]|uniref:Uncharacterized protein n=1 Tax=Portunus trituberculatus TaxID=210409 RepID=A0A5B7D6N7_PORTR|nr:hypothetical protein [Portunus trituberculatus]
MSVLDGWRAVDSRGRRWPVTTAGPCQLEEEGLGVLQHLGLAGVNRVASPQDPWSRRVAWAVVLACGLAGTIFLISDKAQQYLRRPTTMRVSYDDANLTALPSVTVCPRSVSQSGSQHASPHNTAPTHAGTFPNCNTLMSSQDALQFSAQERQGHFGEGQKHLASDGKSCRVAGRLVG